MLLLQNITVCVDKKTILQNVSLHVQVGSLHVIMGQNGSGKSSLASVLMGHPLYEVTDGSVLYQGKDLVAISIQDRSKQGLFLAFQQPVSIPGVTVFQFLKEIYIAAGKPLLSALELQQLLESLLQQVALDISFLGRGLHENFSGGEKKRLEIVQMLLLQPKLIILDEIDSGLDVDALRIIGRAVQNYLQEHKDVSCIVITHYRRILDYLKPDRVHIMHQGTIVHSGDVQLSHEIEEKGYDVYFR